MQIYHNPLHTLWYKSDPKAGEGKLPAYTYFVEFCSIAKERGKRYDRICFMCDTYVSLTEHQFSWCSGALL